MQGDPGPHTPGPLDLRGCRPSVLGWLGLQFHARVKSVPLKQGCCLDQGPLTLQSAGHQLGALVERKWGRGRGRACGVEVGVR